MRIPTRAAPHPPVNSVAQRNSIWSNTNDIFGAALIQRSLQKKIPPPRPPPPKFNQNHVKSQRDQKPKKATRPTELLTNLFSRKTLKSEHADMYRSHSQLQNAIPHAVNTNGTMSLIDLSPPESPTFTTRSSSDAVSIDSFGSDGNSNPSAFTSSGNTSQTESAFEDDFDFFGVSCKKTVTNDPWQVKQNQDPFGPLEEYSNAPRATKREDTGFFALNSDNYHRKQVPLGNSNLKPAQSMPTIIRSRPSKPTVPKTLQNKVTVPKIQESHNGSTSLYKAGTSLSESVSLGLTNTQNDTFHDSPSPPMPTFPPPVPPPEYLTQFDSTQSLEKPYGIALYDFPTSQSGDLPLKEGDIVLLSKVVNDDWMEGCIGHRQGIFPSNFIDIKVPLPGLENVVTALYPFQAETTEDLSFAEGAKITVLSRISHEWLYGESEGRRGQFPANYVNRIPSNITASL